MAVASRKQTRRFRLRRGNLRRKGDELLLLCAARRRRGDRCGWRDGQLAGACFGVQPRPEHPAVLDGAEDGMGPVQRLALGVRRQNRTAMEPVGRAIQHGRFFIERIVGPGHGLRHSELFLQHRSKTEQHLADERLETLRRPRQRHVPAHRHGREVHDRPLPPRAAFRSPSRSKTSRRTRPSSRFPARSMDFTGPPSGIRLPPFSPRSLRETRRRTSRSDSTSPRRSCVSVSPASTRLRRTASTSSRNGRR